MIKYGLIIALIAVVWIFRENIKNGVVGFVFLGGLLFFVIFLVDSYTEFPIRSLVGLETYDELKNNPKEKLSEYGDIVLDTGKSSWENLNEFGDKLDEKYDTGLNDDDEEDVDYSDITDDELYQKRLAFLKSQQEEDLKDLEIPIPIEELEQENGKDKKKNKKKDKNVQQNDTLESNQFLYKTINTDLKNQLKHLTDKEKSYVKGLSPLIDMEFESDRYLFKSIKGEHYYLIEPLSTKKNKEDN